MVCLSLAYKPAREPAREMAPPPCDAGLDFQGVVCAGGVAGGGTIKVSWNLLLTEFLTRQSSC
jgi:hypothetical protein